MDEHQLIYGLPDTATHQTKEVKMNLPIHFLVRLHGLKILTGVTISETVTKALDAYFQNAQKPQTADVVDSTTEPVAPAETL